MNITETALYHFQELLAKEEKGTALRIEVLNPGTVQADVGIAFCPPGDALESDILMNFGELTLYVDKPSIAALSDAHIDFKPDKLGGHLSIKAPHLKGHAPSDESPLADRVQYVIDSEINPNLASHGGKVSLIEIESDGSDGVGCIVVLKFGGGCHGCGMANVTLKHGIEKTLKDKFPEIKEVRDVTDHASGENPYY